jgi:hypothetical protein
LAIADELTILGFQTLNAQRRGYLLGQQGQGLHIIPVNGFLTIYVNWAAVKAVTFSRFTEVVSLV